MGNLAFVPTVLLLMEKMQATMAFRHLNTANDNNTTGKINDESVDTVLNTDGTITPIKSLVAGVREIPDQDGDGSYRTEQQISQLF